MISDDMTATTENRKPTILVVDDNPTNLKLVTDVLEFEGYHILKANDAEDAQAILAGTLPELILMDIALPGMDGLTLTRKIKREITDKNIIIVALTAFAMKGDEEKALAAGCDGYITKPIDTRKLPLMVADFLKVGSPGKIRVESKLNILVVEDDSSHRKLASLVISEAGHNVFEVTLAAEALLAIKTNKPDVVLLDLELPGMDGLKLTRELKSDPMTRTVCVVAVTSYPDRYTKTDAVGAGCNAYLVKPINTRTLSQFLERVAAENKHAASPPDDDL
jgi:two-component system cell cycle response regulator